MKDIKHNSVKADVRRGLIKIYKHNMPNSVVVYFDQIALDILSVKEIVFIEKEGQLIVRRPHLETRNAKTIGSRKTISFTSTDRDAILGEYYIEGDGTEDEFLLNLA